MLDFITKHATTTRMEAHDDPVILDICMSLDGFIAAPNHRPGKELGDGGQRLREWALDTASDRDREVLDEMWSGAGAYLGRADGTSVVRALP